MACTTACPRLSNEVEGSDEDWSDGDGPGVDCIALREARLKSSAATVPTTSSPTLATGSTDTMGKRRAECVARSTGSTPACVRQCRVRFDTVQLYEHAVTLDGSKLPSDGLAPIGLGVLESRHVCKVDAYEAQRCLERHGDVVVIPPEERRRQIADALVSVGQDGGASCAGASCDDGGVGGEAFDKAEELLAVESENAELRRAPHCCPTALSPPLRPSSPLRPRRSPPHSPHLIPTHPTRVTAATAHNHSSGPRPAHTVPTRRYLH
jgi:hypothetical protein